MNTSEIRIEDYDYHLPEEQIARYPLPQRDASRLLIYQKGIIRHSPFTGIVDELGEGDLLISNNTRVIAARLHFKRQTGATIEVFCLEPVESSHQDAMGQCGSSTWKCLVGGAKKWKDGEKITCITTLEDKEVILSATRLEQVNDAFIICFEWSITTLPFSEILHAIGELPLPPYFHRKAEKEDYDRYQTVFAIEEGSVAAPTAGLHFTQEVLNSLKAKGIKEREVTLHVGAGTFKPVASETMEGHTMHSESFSISIDLLREIVEQKGRIIAVGTTSMRTLESLYWMGVKMLDQSERIALPTLIEQWEPYQNHTKITVKESLEIIIKYCEANNKKIISGATSILIAPGYQFRICDGLITNFHMPKSTLLLLVSAFIGEDWKKVYDYALSRQFRFLSYGDSSLLWRAQ